MDTQYDSVVSSVISAFQKRAEIGQIKYGKTLDRNDLTFLQWIQHAQEELMDGILYLEKISCCKRDHPYLTLRAERCS